MPYGFLDLMATPSVRAAQAQNGVAAMWEGLEVDRAAEDLHQALLAAG